MQRFLYHARATIFALRRLIVFLAILPWLVWLPPSLLLGEGLIPQGWDRWLMLCWPPLMLALVIRFPAAVTEHLALALLVGFLATLLPAVQPWIALLPPVDTGRLIIATLVGALIAVLTLPISWALLNLAITLLQVSPPRLRITSKGQVRSTLPPQRLARALRYAPMQANSLRMTGAADADGWFPMWFRYPWERRQKDDLPAEMRSTFIGPRPPDIWMRIINEDPLSQRVEERITGPIFGPAPFVFVRSIEPDGAGSRLTEREIGIQVPALMALLVWLAAYNSAHARAAVDHLEGLPDTTAPFIQSGSPLLALAALMGDKPAPQPRSR